MTGEGKPLLTERMEGLSAISSAALIWGFSYVSTKYAIGEIDPFALILLRVVTSAAFFVLVVRITRLRPLSLRRHWREFLPLAVFGIAGSQILWVYGLRYTTPSHSALMFALMPIFTAVLAAVILHERLSPANIAGVLLAFVGVALLAMEGGFSLDSAYLYGDLVTLAAFFCFALYTVLSKPLVERHGTHRVLATTFVLSLPVVIPFTIMPSLSQRWSSDAISPLGWTAIIYLIVFATIGTSHLYQYALKRLPSSRVAIFANLQILFAAFFSVLLGFEQLSGTFYLSAVLILLGLFLSRR